MEEEIAWDDWTWTRTLNVADAWRSVRGQITTLCRQFDTKDVVFALSGTDNWRKKVLPTYKANRVGVKKPCGYGALRAEALKHPAAKMHDALEADDIMGLYATAKGEPCVIVSSDKDMKSVPGTLYNPTKDETAVLTLEEADHRHLMQTLTGDTSDGYKGCPSMGAVKAAKLLDGLAPTDRWPAIVAAYEKAGLSEQEALTQARIARILRHGEFNFRTGEVKLWNPQ